MFLTIKDSRNPARSTGVTRIRLLGAALLAVGTAMALPLPARGFQPNTMRLGSLEIHPSFFTEVTYNDNISLTKEKIPDVIFKQAPGLSLQWGRMHVPLQLPRVGSPYAIPQDLILDLYLLRLREMGERGFAGRGRQELPVGRPLESVALSSMRLRKIAFSLNYEPTFINLVDNPEFNSIDQNLSFAADIRLPSGFYLRVDDAYQSSTSINNFRYEVADFNRVLLSQGVGYSVNQAAVTLGYNFFADYLAFVTYSNYFLFLDNFDFSQLIEDAGLQDFVQLGVEGLGSNNLGFVIHAVGVFLMKPINRKTVLSAGYQIGFIRGNLDNFTLTGSFLEELVPFSLRVDSDPRNAVFQEVQFKFQRILTVKKYVFGVGVPKTTLEGTFSYQMRRYEGAQIEIRALDMPVETLPFPLEDFNEFFVELKLNSQIRPRTNVWLEFSRYPREEIGGSGNVSINYGFAAAVTQRIRTKWSVGARGSFRLRENPFESAVEQESYHYRATGNISYNLQTWLRASVIYQFLARDGEISYNDFTGQRVRLQIRADF